MHLVSPLKIEEDIVSLSQFNCLNKYKWNMYEQVHAFDGYLDRSLITNTCRCTEPVTSAGKCQVNQ